MLFSRFFHRPSAAFVLVPKGRSFLYPFLVLSALILSLAIIQAPSFLIVAEEPVKADAAVVFVGGEKGPREKEAEELLKEGLAHYLIIPAFGKIQKLSPDGKIEAFEFRNPIAISTQNTNGTINQLNLGRAKEPTNQSTRFAENTHIEVLMAKRLMENLNLRSALMVSSPYHMRRIKIISEKVFQDQMEVRYKPTRYESFGKGFWLLNDSERKTVLTEYTKILWFLLYFTFLL